ncbi:MAG: winged helix DNA-binding domain-containing protein [Bacteroidota bacterium]
MEILKQRLLNQQITKHSFNNAPDVVKWFGAVQAQDYAGAKWALALRLKNAKEVAVEKALTNGEILRTHVMRPTWHFVSPADIRWMLELTAPRVNAGNATRYREFELTEKVLNKCHDILTQALEGNKHLTRDELSAILNKDGIGTHDNRAAHIMLHAELAGLICSGARNGNQFTYALLDERAPKTQSIDRDEALAKLIKRYFTSHGPATVHDCAWWSGLTLADVRRGIAIAGDKLSTITINDSAYWFVADMPEAGKMSSKIYMLPTYDEYIVGYADRSALAAASHINARNNALFSNTIIAKGKVAGIWKRTLKKDEVLIEPEIFGKVDKNQLQKAADLYGKYLGKTADILV